MNSKDFLDSESSIRRKKHESSDEDEDEHHTSDDEFLDDNEEEEVEVEEVEEPKKRKKTKKVVIKNKKRKDHVSPSPSISSRKSISSKGKKRTNKPQTEQNLLLMEKEALIQRLLDDRHRQPSLPQSVIQPPIQHPPTLPPLPPIQQSISKTYDPQTLVELPSTDRSVKYEKDEQGNILITDLKDEDLSKCPTHSIIHNLSVQLSLEKCESQNKQNPYSFDAIVIRRYYKNSYTKHAGFQGRPQQQFSVSIDKAPQLIDSLQTLLQVYKKKKPLLIAEAKAEAAATAAAITTNNSEENQNTTVASAAAASGRK